MALALTLTLALTPTQEDDGSKWEDWIEARHVRPLPPPHKADFVKQLKKGAPLELLLEEVRLRLRPRLRIRVSLTLNQP